VNEYTRFDVWKIVTRTSILVPPETNKLVLVFQNGYDSKRVI